MVRIARETRASALRRRSSRIRRRAGGEPDCLRGERGREFFPGDVGGAGDTEPGAHNQRRQRTQRRQARHREANGPAHTGIGGQPFEMPGGIPERYAPIPLAVFVPALETLSLIAEHQRPGGHQGVAGGRTVLEAAREHNRDGVARMPFRVGAIGWAARAHDVGNGPAGTSCDDSRQGASRLTVLSSTAQCLFQGDSNFCQERTSRCVL